VAAQIRMSVAERDALSPLRTAAGNAGDPAKYQQVRQWFESTADPRIWQYEELKKSDPAAAKKFIARQPDIQDLAQRAAALEAQGFFGKKK